MWPRDCVCDILVKNMTGAKLKIYGLAALREDISKQPSIDFAPRLLMPRLIQIYNEKKKTKQGKMQNVCLGETRTTQKYKQVKEKPPC